MCISKCAKKRELKGEAARMFLCLSVLVKMVETLVELK